MPARQPLLVRGRRGTRRRTLRRLYGVPDPYFYGRDDRNPKFDLDEDGYWRRDILSHLAKLDGGGAAKSVVFRS